MRVGGDHPACQPASFSHSSLHSGAMTDGRGRKGRGGSRRGGGLQCTRRTHGRRNELPIPFFGSKSRPGVEAKSPQQQRRREELAPGARPPATVRVRCARERVIIAAAAALNQCHFVAFAATEFSEWSPRASRAPVIAVNACTCQARLRMNEHTAPGGNHSP